MSRGSRKDWTGPQRGEKLLARITNSLLIFGGTPERAWKDFVSHDGEYAYENAAETFMNLTEAQMQLLDGFLYEHGGDTFPIANAARAAYDAGSSPRNAHLLSNLVLAYADVSPFNYSCPYDEFEYSHLNVYRAVSGINEDISQLPVSQQKGAVATAQFALGNFRMESIDPNLISWTHEKSGERPSETISLTESSLCDFLLQNPEAAREMLALKHEHDKVSVAALIAMIDGSTVSALVSGCL